MRKKIKILSIILFAVIVLFCGKKEVQARSYSIENMDIQATIQQDGSVKVKQQLTYKFNGSFNGIYMNIPYSLEDNAFKDVEKTNKINDDFYNGSEVIINKVSLLNNGNEIKFTEIEYATNGMNSVYTNSKKTNRYELKVYCPSEDITKTFEIDYKIKNLCVKHNDIGELYYNFIGGEWETKIKNLNIDIYIPENKSEIKIWGHGPYNGNCKIISNSHANFQVKNIKPGQYVAARVLFDNSNIAKSQKLSRINAKEMIYKDENAIIENKEEKNAFTWKIIIFAACLLIYWIILMVIFEKDKKYPVSDINEEELFEKYNPMIAGCIQGSRTILARDIIAVILNLINKKIIHLNIEPYIGKDKYLYRVGKNETAENQMDSIEKYVYDWIFEKEDQVLLSDRLKKMPKEKEANKKFKELNKLVENNLAQKGANQAKVPLSIRVFNVFLFILSIAVIVKHIMFNGFEIYYTQTSSFILIHILIFMVTLMPLIIGALYIPINLIIIARHKINKTVQRITGQKVVTTTISLIVLFTVIIILTAIISPEKYMIADEILICIATILILTDNLMLKNNKAMIKDYSRLNALKDKIKDYTLMEDRDIEQVTLWEQYLSYAVSFGIANKIAERIKGLNIDDDLESLFNSTIFTDFIASDYSTFYTYASLDRRFVESYKNTTDKMMGEIGSGGFSGGFSSGRRRWILRRRRLFWRWRKRPEEAEPFKIR